MDMNYIFSELQHISRIISTGIFLYRQKHLIFASDNIENLLECDPVLTSSLFAAAECPGPGIVVHKESNLVHFGVLSFPAKDSEWTCIAGPFSSHSMSRSDRIVYAKSHGITKPGQYHIHSFTYAQNQQLQLLLYEVLTGENFSGDTRFPDNFTGATHAPHISAFSITQYHMNNSEELLHHHPYEHEKILSEFIKDGDMDGIYKLFTNLAKLDYAPGTMARTYSKQEEYKTVIAISLFVHAAIDGGVNPYDAYDLSDLCLQKLSVVQNPEAYNDIFLSSLQSFVQLVQHAKNAKQQSIHTKKCKQYILRHLNMDITLDILAKETGLSRSYLSALFHEIEGITIQEYILTERIRAAENMLKYSNLSIAEIAHYLKFQDQSYFGKMFKKHTGKSPGIYRKENK